MKQGMYLKSIVTLLLALCLLSCSNDKVLLSPLNDDATILAFGDSLTYGSGSNSTTQSYPAILAQLTGLNVINAGIPGEVSQYGLERLADAIQETNPSLVILCHGGNDIIRKLGKVQLKQNLEQMISLIQDAGAEVILIGVPNFSLMLNVPDLYPELATAYNIPIELTILPKIERSPKLKSDQIHPNAQGYSLMAESIYSLLQDSGAILN